MRGLLHLGEKGEGENALGVTGQEGDTVRSMFPRTQPVHMEELTVRKGESGSCAKGHTGWSCTGDISSWETLKLPIVSNLIG